MALIVGTATNKDVVKANPNTGKQMGNYSLKKQNNGGYEYEKNIRTYNEPKNEDVKPETKYVYVNQETPTQDYSEYKSYVDNAYNAQKSAADAYMANVRKYANETYDENQRKSYSGLRAIERALSRRNTPFTGSQLWTVGQAYNNYNNTLTGFGKTRQQAIDTGNVNYLSQLATAEGNKTDRYLKLLNA